MSIHQKVRWVLDYKVEGITERLADELLQSLRYGVLKAENRDPIWAEYHHNPDGGVYWRFRCDCVPEFFAICRADSIKAYFKQWAGTRGFTCDGSIYFVVVEEEE